MFAGCALLRGWRRRREEETSPFSWRSERPGRAAHTELRSLRLYGAGDGGFGSACPLEGGRRREGREERRRRRLLLHVHARTNPQYVAQRRAPFP